MNQLSIRGFDKELERRIREVAKKRHLSLNKAALRRKGTPIPTNDIWIAAHAMESGADLLSFDEHFGAVDGIAWIHPRRLGSPDQSP